jgi:hypothetical protein
LMSLWSFQGACATGAPHRKCRPSGPVSQNSAAIVHIEVDVVLGESDAGRTMFPRVRPKPGTRD